MSKLLANMIVYNESDRYLAECLEALSKYVDEIIITDDCSEDETVDICRNFTDKVYVNQEHQFSTNEGLLRQVAWDNLSNHASVDDWIFCIDADEFLFETREHLNKLLESDCNILQLLWVNMWNEESYRTDKSWQPNKVNRLFRYRHDGKIKDKKLACGSEPTYVENWALRRDGVNANTGLILKHRGYETEHDKHAKYDRYMRIDKGKYHSLTHLRSILTKPSLAPFSDLKARLPNVS